MYWMLPLLLALSIKQEDGAAAYTCFAKEKAEWVWSLAP